MRINELAETTGLSGKTIRYYESKWNESISDYEEQLVRQLIEKLTINEDKVIVEFKSGVSIDIEGYP